jgi:hypothetical protein
MAPRRPALAFLGAASALLCGCSPSGGGAASSQAAAGEAPPAAASTAPSDPAASSLAASAPPPVAAEPPPAPAQVRPAAAPAAPPRREPTPAELLRNDPAYVARGQRLDALYQNARERDPTGQVDHDQAAALAELQACPDRACLDRWFSRRESALREYVGN